MTVMANDPRAQLGETVRRKRLTLRLSQEGAGTKGGSSLDVYRRNRAGRAKREPDEHREDRTCTGNDRARSDELDEQRLWLPGVPGQLSRGVAVIP